MLIVHVEFETADEDRDTALAALRDEAPIVRDLPDDARLMFDTLAMLARRLSRQSSRAWMVAGQSEGVRRALGVTEMALAGEIGFEAVAQAAGVTARACPAVPG